MTTWRRANRRIPVISPYINTKDSLADDRCGGLEAWSLSHHTGPRLPDLNTNICRGGGTAELIEPRSSCRRWSPSRGLVGWRGTRQLFSKRVQWGWADVNCNADRNEGGTCIWWTHALVDIWFYRGGEQQERQMQNVSIVECKSVLLSHVHHNLRLFFSPCSFLVIECTSRDGLDVAFFYFLFSGVLHERNK